MAGARVGVRKRGNVNGVAITMGDSQLALQGWHLQAAESGAERDVSLATLWRGLKLRLGHSGRGKGKQQQQKLALVFTTNQVH